MKKKMLHKKKKRLSYEVIIAILAVVVILSIIAIFNYDRIILMIKGYNFSEQSIILNLDEEDVKRILETDELITISEWDEISNHHHYLEY